MFSLFSCFLSGIQHSAPYRRTDKTHALYIFHLFVSRKTDFLRALKSLDVWATLLFTSTSILPEFSISDPRYGNSSTIPQHHPHPEPHTPGHLPPSCLVFGRLTFRPRSAGSLFCTRSCCCQSSANGHSMTLLSLAFLLNSFSSYFYLTVTPPPPFSLAISPCVQVKEQRSRAAHSPD